MALRLDISSSDFTHRFRAFLDTKREASADVEAAVRDIVNDVARRGDSAVRDYTIKFDQLDLAETGFRVSAAEIGAAEKSCSRDALNALELARGRIETYHRRQLPRDDSFVDPLGVELG
ncbi:MAG TPA: histidinol dehydrogenase, partial [Xanthobacteraceae bacterium]|nr:histidinol dehydrogenase [Xanthobacteraceae bacterium]